ncbi:MAG TPA: DUF1073 domain-containing protein [Methanoregulaceae archaeon]|nr:DUF1073 domain-containing protein [Methanoregulaceae archaeon]
MALTLDTLRRWARRLAAPAPDRTTRATAGGTAAERFGKRPRTREQVAKWRQIYEQGGIVAEAVDCYPLYVLTNGYRLESQDPQAKQLVEDEFARIGIRDLLWQAVVDATVCGDSFQEYIPTKVGKFVGVESRDPSTFEIDADEYGKVTQYRQVFGAAGVDAGTVVPVDRIIRFSPMRMSGRAFGMSRLGRAFDEIVRDVETAEGSHKAIKRHGTPKWDIAVAPQFEGDSVADDLPAIKKEYEDMNSKSEFVHDDKIAVKEMDTVGAVRVLDYNDLSLQRLCSALGVPEELVGLRRGSSDATAVERIRAFFGKIGTLQLSLADVYNRELIDRITGVPGLVKMVFNDVSPEDEAAKAEWIAKIMQATPLDPFAVLPQEWVQQQFGIEPHESDAPTVPVPEGA